MLRGTGVATPTGDRAVETLVKGDLVATADGEVKPIVRIGKRTVARTPGANWSKRFMPVRIAASAISANVPSRTVYLSQAHAISIDGTLVRAGDLVNGLSITLEPPAHSDALEYYHIQLAAHEMVIASGLAIETLNVAGESTEFDGEQPPVTTGEALPTLYLAGGTAAVKSRLRSAMSPWLDSRNKFDKLRDKVEQRSLRQAA